MKFKDFKQELLKDPKFRKEYFKKDLKFEIACMVIEARILKGVTQEKLAKLMGTKQSSISRIESGNYLPGLKFLEKMAYVLKTDFIPPHFAFLEKRQSEVIDKTINIPEDYYNNSEVVKEAARLIKYKISSPAYHLSI